jgi:type IX secretion system PorP/SprF family membrane protein
MYGEAPTVINPALTGVAYDFRANVNYKSQWKSLNSAYSTYAANFETAFKHKKLNKAHMSAGANFYRDMSGDGKMATTSFNLNLATVIKVGKYNDFSLGLMGGATTRTLKSPENLTWENQYDGFKYQSALPSGEYDQNNSFTRADFGGGINFHHSESDLYLSSNNGSRFDIGAAVYHYNSPENSFFGYGSDKENLRYNAYATAVFCKSGSNLCFAPGVIYQAQGPAKEVILSSLFKFIINQQSVHTDKEKPSAISAGLQYRFKDALIPTFLYEYDKYAIGLAYDINLSNLTTASKSKGGFEFALRYNWNPGYGKMIGGSWWGSSHSNQ